MRFKRVVYTVLVCLCSQLSVSCSYSQQSHQHSLAAETSTTPPTDFPLDLVDLLGAAATCETAARPALEIIGASVTRESCRELGAAAMQLWDAASERELEDFDRRLLAENLLYLSRNAAIKRTGEAAIQTEDVSFFGVGFLLERIGWRRPRCFLRVDSVPKGSEIYIDGDFQAYTYQRFVLSPGEHIVRIENAEQNLHCEHELTIPPDREAAIGCPE